MPKLSHRFLHQQEQQEQQEQQRQQPSRQQQHRRQKKRLWQLSCLFGGAVCRCIALVCGIASATDGACASAMRLAALLPLPKPPILHKYHCIHCIHCIHKQQPTQCCKWRLASGLVCVCVHGPLLLALHSAVTPQKTSVFCCCWLACLLVLLFLLFPLPCTLARLVHLLSPPPQYRLRLSIKPRTATTAKQSRKQSSKGQTKQ